MERAGFEGTEVVERTVYTHVLMESYLSCDCCAGGKVGDADLSGIIASSKVVALKPRDPDA
jgi:uncharacterized Fe-S center protein